MDSKNTWESGHCLFSNDNQNDSDIDSDAHSCLSEQRKVAAVVDSATAICAAICEDIQVMWKDATSFVTSFPNSYQAYY